MIVDALEILKIVMDNPVSRKVLRMGLKTGQGSHMKKIEHALAIFAGEEDRTTSLATFIHGWYLLF